MIDIRRLPVKFFPTFSCPMEMIIWLARRTEDPLVQVWWMGYDAAVRGAEFSRVEWELANVTSNPKD